MSEVFLIKRNRKDVTSVTYKDVTNVTLEEDYFPIKKATVYIHYLEDGMLIKEAIQPKDIIKLSVTTDCKEVAKLKEKNDKTDNDLKEYMVKYSQAENKANKLDKENEHLKKENEIMREYYELDKEPTIEQETRIHINLEINRLKEEIERLNLELNCRPNIMPYPYPVYYGGLGRM